MCQDPLVGHLIHMICSMLCTIQPHSVPLRAAYDRSRDWPWRGRGVYRAEEIWDVGERLFGSFFFLEQSADSVTAHQDGGGACSQQLGCAELEAAGCQPKVRGDFLGAIRVGRCEELCAGGRTCRHDTTRTVPMLGCAHWWADDHFCFETAASSRVGCKVALKRWCR